MKKFSNYEKFKNGMILRDYLALDRTKLANERTLLAYLRTFIGTLGAGIGMVKLFEQPFAITLGYILMAVSPIFLVMGVRTYVVESRKLKTLDSTKLETEDDNDNN